MSITGRILLLLMGFIMLTYNIYGQSDTLISKPTITTSKADSLSPKKKKKLAKKIRLQERTYSPKKAVLLSLALPGAGQIYNRRYWKLPFVYGAIGTMTYFVITNTQDLKDFRTAYFLRTDGDPDTVDDFDGIFSDSNLQTLRNSAQKNVELSYVGLFVAYTLTGVDAFVDAHLKSFNISEDLSMSIGPDFTPAPTTPGLGLGIQIRTLPTQKVVYPELF